MSVAVDEETFWLGDWKVEPTLNRIVRGEEIVRIDPRNMKVLQLLASKPGEVFSQAEIEESVWSDVIVTPNSVYQSIAQLRRALGDEKDNPKYIETIARKGYRIATVVTKQTLTNATLGKESSVAIARKGKSALFLFLAIATMATLSNYSHRLSVRTESLASASQSHSIPEPPLTLGELPKAANLQPRLLVELATVALADGKSREARDYLTKALEMERRRVGDNHPAIAEILRELAMAHVWESNYDAAESAAYGALDAVAGYPESHHEHIDSTLRLGYVLLERGKYESSEAYLRRALDLSMEVLGEK